MKMKTWKKAMLILLMLALSLIFVSPTAKQLLQGTEGDLCL